MTITMHHNDCDNKETEEYNELCSELCGLKPNQTFAYDYENQAYIIGGHYVSCSHPKEMDCICYGKLHAGEEAPKELVA